MATSVQQCILWHWIYFRVWQRSHLCYVPVKQTQLFTPRDVPLLQGLRHEWCLCGSQAGDSLWSNRQGLRNVNNTLMCTLTLCTKLKEFCPELFSSSLFPSSHPFFFFNSHMFSSANRWFQKYVIFHLKHRKPFLKVIYQWTRVWPIWLGLLSHRTMHIEVVNSTFLGEIG